MTRVKNPYPLCERDKFPMIKIDGKLQCVAEYLDRCIGQQKVVDLIQRGKTTYYVFENGHQLPALCFCCGEPLIFDELAKSRRKICGRRLEEMSVGYLQHEDGDAVLEFCMHFSKKWLLSRKFLVSIAPEAARKMQHPPDCKYA